MTKRITVPYFHIGLKFITPPIFGTGIYLAIAGHPAWAFVLVLTGGIILTTRYITEINLTERKCRDYLSLLGIPLNEEAMEFKNLERIVITKGNYAQTINTRAQSRQMDWSDYTGTLIFDNDRTLDLLTRNNKAELIKGLKEFTDFLHVQVEDRSTNKHTWIDMSKI